MDPMMPSDCQLRQEFVGRALKMLTLITIVILVIVDIQVTVKVHVSDCQSPCDRRYPGDC